MFKGGNALQTKRLAIEIVFLFVISSILPQTIFSDQKARGQDLKNDIYEKHLTYAALGLPQNGNGNNSSDNTNVNLNYRLELSATHRYLKNISLDDTFVDGIDSYYMAYPNQCIVIDGVVYVASLYDNALEIVNATDPTHLTEISHTQDGTYLNAPRDVAVTDDSKYCYIITYETNAHLSMWDVSNKLSPTRINQTVFNGETGMSCIMDTANNYLYVCTQTEVRIINITNKANHQMNVMSTFHTGMGSTRQIWLATPYKKTVYISNIGTGNTNGYGEFVYNITDKTSPQYIRTLNATLKTNLGCPIYTYHGFDYFIYVARYVVDNTYFRGYIECWNITSDPNNPAFMWAKDTLGADGSKDNFSEGGIAIKNGYIFIGQANQNNTNKKVGINVWNATTIESKPTYMFHFGYAGSPYYMKVEHELEFDRNGSDATLFGLSENDYALVTVHLNWTNPNKPPVAHFIYTINDRSVTFNGSASYDPDGNITLWHWDFGDGLVGTGKIATHSYSAYGTYNVTLTVTDDGWKTDETTQNVTLVKIPVFRTAILFGKITNLSTVGEYITFNAVKTRVLVFIPFSFNTYTSGEQITITKQYHGIVDAKHIVALGKLVL